ncbi:MAG TPA: M23 family metallopeptidase [Nocardioides sp.]|nr:M23 family metallopeptidase [Nocardioides sp.]
MTARTASLLLAAAVSLSACSGTDAPPSGDDARSAPSSRHAGHQRPSHPVTQSTAATATPAPTRPTRSTSPAEPVDPRWVFYTDDRRAWTSPWFGGAHRIMIPFGCTPAPYYDPDPTCPDGQGKHHGIDVAMPCGTPLTAGRPAEVLDHAALGSAYGVDPVLLRVGGQDVVIGHTTRVFVAPGDHLAPGERFALAGDSGAPDGCHLHFEVRPAGADYTAAVDPRPLLGLTVAGRP